MAVDRQNVNTGIVALLAADATLQGLIGTPPRIYTVVDKRAIVPFVRMDIEPAQPPFKTKKGPGLDWVVGHTVTFVAITDKRSLDDASAIIAAIFDVMKDAPANMTITGANVVASLAGPDFVDFDPENGTGFGSVEFTLQVQDTS